jgi:F0F1-type ATP synthase membrane subunit b/b'
MAETKNNGSKAKTQAKRATTEAKKSAAKTAKASKRAATKAAVAEKNQVQAAVETAVDFPVGAVLAVSDRLSDLAEPWTDRSKAERQIKSYRSNLRKSLKRTERRGSTARRRAITEARKTRNQVEREARKRQRDVETTLKRNRNEVEQRVRRAIEVPTSRAQDLVGSAQGVVDSVSSQLTALR